MGMRAAGSGTTIRGMKQPVHIRRATDGDIPEMHRIRMSVRENQLADAGLIRPEDYRVMLNERGRGWVAELDGQLAGFAIADLKRSNIWALFVTPAFESCGFGRRLHDTMLDWLFTSGAQQVWLSTEPGTRAERFYLAAQWQPCGLDANAEARYIMSRRAWLTST